MSLRVGREQQTRTRQRAMGRGLELCSRRTQARAVTSISTRISGLTSC